MTEQEFTNRIDGLINDYEGGESTSKELRDGILDTLMELVSKVSPFEARVKPDIAVVDLVGYSELGDTYIDFNWDTPAEQWAKIADMLKEQNLIVVKEQ